MKKRIAVVDDDIYWLADLQSTLQKWYPSAQVDIFWTAQAFYSLVNAKVKFRVAILDGSIGDASGPEVAKRIFEVSPSTGIVGISGNPKYEEGFKSARVGLFIHKSDYHESLNRIREFVGNHLQ